MNYELNPDSFIRIINSEVVPDNNSNGLEFEIGNTEISIKKPYIDLDGDEMGNSIFIQHDNGLIVNIRTESGFLFVFFKENEKDSFKTLGQTSPDSVKEFVRQIWIGIVDYIENPDEHNSGGNDGNINLNSFEAQFGIYGVPYDLEKLFEFESEYGAESYAESFYLNIFDKTGLKTYSTQESFLLSFIEFATATASGSIYAIWVINENLDICPIVVFGDEGGIHLVAKNTKEFIRLLSYDTEIMVTGESAWFYKSGISDNQRKNRRAFLHWIKANFGMEPIETDDEANLIIKAAKDKFANSLYDFLIKYDIDTEEGFENIKE